MHPDIDQQIERALALDKLNIARLISRFEDRRPSAPGPRKQILERLAARASRQALFVGITGTPGAGKSTLIGTLAARLVEVDAAIAVAVLAVDPSSHVSGGAFLGDRTRVNFPADQQRLFFRSQASDLDLGGVSRTTFQVCRLLHRLFDVVFVETVGIGQSEVEIQHVADWTYLVLQPLGGDQIQFLKAGIMEIPDAIVLNKCDAGEVAKKSYHALRASVSLARPDTSLGEIEIHRTSALSGEGIDELVDEIRQLPHRLTARGRPVRQSMEGKEAYFFDKWVRDEFGRAGVRALRRVAADAAAFIAEAGSFDDAQAAFADRLAGQLGGEVAGPATGEASGEVGQK